MEKKTGLELQQIIDQAKEHVPVGSKRVHYKNPTLDKSYNIEDIVIEQSTQKAMIIYQGLYDDLQGIRFARPITSFLETIECEGQTIPRFQRINVSPVISTEA